MTSDDFVWFLTYLPTLKSDVICWCFLSKAFMSMSIKERLGHKFPPDFFLLACFPPGFSSRQTLLLAFYLPNQFVPWDIFPPDFLLIPPRLSSTGTLFSWLVISPGHFPPGQLFSLDFILPASDSPWTFSSQTLVSLGENPPGNLFTRYTILLGQFTP